MTAGATPSEPIVPRSLSGSGALYAVAAYSIWGVAPIYWKQLVALPASEILAYRAIGSLVFSALLLASAGQLGQLRAALRSTGGAWLLAGSGALLGLNWWLFIWAVNAGRIVDTSLGYYLTPLINVALGLAVFRERMSARSWTAVGLAAVGVGFLTWDLGKLPWISLALGGSFAVYGALRKYAGAPSIGGFTLEMLALLLPGLLYLGLLQTTGSSALLRLDELPPGTAGLLAGCGVVTATPLLCFGSAAKRLPLTAVGFFQYLAPTLSLAIAVWLYDEPFTRTHAITFSLIWSALIVYTWDNLRARA